MAAAVRGVKLASEPTARSIDLLGFDQLVAEMVDADRKLAERDALIARECFPITNPRE